MGAPKGKGKGKLAPWAKGKGKGKDKGKGKGKGKDTSSKGKGKGEKQWVAVKGTVLVTGASGFVATNVVRRLLAKGYKVRGTVRSLDSDNAAILRKNFPQLELFAADLLGGGEAFEKAMEGCNFVHHTASPFKTTVADPQKDLIDPALKGTETVMNAAVKQKVKRVVLTSSIAAVGPQQTVFKDLANADKEKVFSEEDWQDTATLTDGPYRMSKYVAEKKAWEIAEAANLELAVICPSFVIGPMISSRTDGESVNFIKAMLDGTFKAQGAGGFPFGVVDVRDISLAHVAAMENADAAGKRFCCTSERGYPKVELAKLLQGPKGDRFKAYDLPTEAPEPVYTPKYTHQRAKEILGFKPRPIDVSLREMAYAAISLGIVERKIVLKPVKFGTVDKLEPEQKGVNLILKVVSKKGEVETKSGAKFHEVSAGDNTGMVTLSLTSEQLSVAQDGKVIEVRNGDIRMVKGFIRLMVGKFGKVAAHEGDAEITPKTTKDISAVEFELA